MITLKTMTRPTVAAGFALLATGALASEVMVEAYGYGNAVSVGQESGNRAALLLVGSGNTAEVLQIGHGVDLDVAILADLARIHVVSGLCPAGRFVAPVTVEADRSLNVVITRCR